MGLSLRGGAIFGDVGLFPFERFWMGGVQFGQQLRGYDETSITPYGYFPERSADLADIQRLGNAYLSLTAEYAVRFNDNMSISAFFDAGNVWADPLDADPTRLFRGAGIGVQLVTPFGPIGLDYAYGFDKTRPGWQLHFRMGPGY
ncbi:BamA/TamA family outer membrane protein [Gemmatimonadota bacterium]